MSSNLPPIAEAYPLDRGIATDPDVIFACDFESGDFSDWDENETPETTKIVSGPGEAFTGKNAVEMTAIPGKSTGGRLIKRFRPGFDTVHARFYAWFPEDTGCISHFARLSGEKSPGYAMGKPGVKPSGDDFFTTCIDPTIDGGKYPPPGIWHLYTYWPDMLPSGAKHWGNPFGKDRAVAVARGRWTCIEMMIRCNTPGQADGVQNFWIDGKPAGPFPGLRWRTTDDLKVSVFWLLFYDTHENQPITRVRMDNVVVAKRYIGPLTGRR